MITTKVSTRDLLILLFEKNRSTKYSAAWLARHFDVKLSTISGVLNKMCKRLMCRRIPNFGPRNGYGYRAR
jgi:DNA-binding MarR family transcriptional regulator